MSDLNSSEKENSGFVNNILLDQSEKQKIVDRLDRLNLPLEAYGLLARLIHAEPGSIIQNARQLGQVAEEVSFNKVTGLTYERIAHPQVLNMIIDDVINGDRDLVVISTDMDNLKGLNDRFDKEDANIGLFKFTSWVNATFRESVEESNLNCNFAAINVDGEGSDSIRIIFSMKKGYKFARKLFDDLSAGHANATLTTKMGERETVELTGGFGYYVLTNSDAQKLYLGQKSMKASAGALYNLATQISDGKMDGNKLFNEALIVDQILSATTIAQLNEANDNVVNFGSRIPQILVSYVASKRKELEAGLETQLV